MNCDPQQINIVLALAAFLSLDQLSAMPSHGTFGAVHSQHGLVRTVISSLQSCYKVIRFLNVNSVYK